MIVGRMLRTLCMSVYAMWYTAFQHGLGGKLLVHEGSERVGRRMLLVQLDFTSCTLIHTAG
jgi:hypothetical protein